jgi:hypothetical protein
MFTARVTRPAKSISIQHTIQSPTVKVIKWWLQPVSGELMGHYEFSGDKLFDELHIDEWNVIGVAKTYRP